MDKQISQLEMVKYRIGVYYSDPMKDAEVQAMIDACKQYLQYAGVSAQQLATPLAVDAYVLWCKMAQSMSPEDITAHPVLISYIAQLRNAGPPKRR